MNLTTETERQQAISYIKGRLAKLSEWRLSLVDSALDQEDYKFAQMKVLDSKIDCLLDNLSELEKGAKPLSQNENES